MHNTNESLALFKKISRKTSQTIHEQKMLEPNDRLLVALSGGKDSYILLETLAECRRHMPFEIAVFAVHVHIEDVGYNINLEYMQTLCDGLRIPLRIIRTIAEIGKDPKKGPCFVCSWHRRKQIFNLTRELNCNKLAFGHHMDDAIQTYIMNQIYHGSISALPYKLSMFDGRVQLIRPLLAIEEGLLADYARMRDYPAEIKNCPYGNDTKRAHVKALLETMYASHRLAKINMFRSMSKICMEYLPSKVE